MCSGRSTIARRARSGGTRAPDGILRWQTTCCRRPTTVFFAPTRYQSEADRRNVLFKIATNLARDARRRTRVLPFFVPDGERDVAAREDMAGQIERTIDVTRAMNELKPRDRAMLWLAYAEGSSHQEIASVMGVKTASVKLLLFRARRRLAHILGRTPAGGGA